MSTMRCEKCLGKKKLVGLGSMMIDCPACKGVGHVKSEEITDKKHDKKR